MTTNNSLVIASINDEGLDLSKIDATLNSFPKHCIGNVNWPDVYNYAPDAQFAIAHSQSHIYVKFFVVGEDLRAVNDKNLSPVAQDSCVEFFLQVPGSPEYWNFEFNCIGTVNASHRVERSNAIRLNDEEIATIGRFSSCGELPFEEKNGIHEWTLTIAIPFTLIGIDVNNLPTHIMGNLYKCADKTAHPHYLSWSPIPIEKPNFHVPQYFGTLNIG